MRKTIAIVGAGFSGTVLAANLLRLPAARATDILLIERGAVMGRGVAYAAHEFPYLLNVPAARLSADSRDPQQFLRFAKARLQNADGEDYLPRALYGDYLQDVLLEAERAAPAQVRLHRVFGEVTDIVRAQTGQPLAAQFKDRPPINADSVVLALGNPPPAPQPWAADVLEHGAFRQDPRDLPKTLTEKQSVLIVGNGLTMADVASVLGGDSNRGPMLQTISRRGLLPRPQSSFDAGAVRGGDAPLAGAQSLRQVPGLPGDGGQIEKWGRLARAIAHIRVAPVLWSSCRRANGGAVRHLQPIGHSPAAPPRWRASSIAPRPELSVARGAFSTLPPWNRG